MSGGWEESASAWITDMGEHGDFSRRHVLDPEMIARIEARGFSSALDVGCGEGRFCRMMRDKGIEMTGLDPTVALLTHANAKDPMGHYVVGRAEAMPFAAETFDLVICYLTLIDIAKLEPAIAEIHRVLKPGGTLLIANLTSFSSAGMDRGWIKDETGAALYYPVDRYLDERSFWLTYRGICIENWHRPLSTYMSLLLRHAFQLVYFSEPSPQRVDRDKLEHYRRAPWFLVMEWCKPTVPAGRNAQL